MVEKNREIVRRILEGKSSLTSPEARRRLQDAERRGREPMVLDGREEGAWAEIIGSRTHARIHGRD